MEKRREKVVMVMVVKRRVGIGERETEEGYDAVGSRGGEGVEEGREDDEREREREEEEDGES